MFRTPTFCSGMLKHSFLAVFGLLFPLFAKATDFGLTLQMSQNGNQVTADALAYNFQDIVSMQFTITWDTTQLEFVSIGDFNLPGLSETNFGIPSVVLAGNGHLTFSWWDPMAQGVSFPDCGAMFRINFNSLNGQVPPLSISNYPTPVELTNSNAEILDLVPGLGCTNMAKMTGKLFRDDNDNCTNDGLDLNLAGWQLKFEVNKLAYFTTTDANGNYEFNCPAGYCKASVVFPNDNHTWESCEPFTIIQVDENQEVTLDFATHDLGPSSNPSSTSNLQKAGFAAWLVQNPISAGQSIQLKVRSAKARSLNLNLLDGSGKLVIAKQQEIQAGESVLTLENNLQAGTYLLRIADDSGDFMVKKLVVN